MAKPRRATTQGETASAKDDWTSDALSLHLFVHLALASDADRGLAATGLNRTHHRILFLITRRPGVTVGEIVNLLRLSAQAIQAPLRTLIDDGLIVQQSSERDRRKRHLILTDRGRAFLDAITSPQVARLSEARRKAGDDSFEGFIRIMRLLTNPADHEWLYPPTAAPPPESAPTARPRPPGNAAGLVHPGRGRSNPPESTRFAGAGGVRRHGSSWRKSTRWIALVYWPN